MAIRADFHLQIVSDGRARFERIAAGAGNADRLVFGMDVGFHGNLVNVCGRIDTHQTDAIATPTRELPSEFENSMPGNYGGRAS
jgi:hypothetical protein